MGSSKLVVFRSLLIYVFTPNQQLNHAELSAFAEDAYKFVSAFQEPISQSASHIYLTALPFSPIESQISKQFLPQYQNILSIESGLNGAWQVPLFEGHTSAVRSIA